MNILNEYFDKIYCINLLRREDRKKKCIEQFDKIGLDVEFFPAIDKLTIKNNSSITDGQLACLSSHYNIIRKAKKNILSNVLIFEDDVVISDDILEVFENSKHDIPDDWMMLYFGGNHLNGLTPVKNNIHKMVSSLTTHAYAIKSDIYDEVLDRVQYADFPIDVYYAHIHRKYPAYLIKNGDNQLIWQETGYSDIDESECNYTWLK